MTMKHSPLNTWYAVATAHEVGRTPLARQIAGGRIVVYRDSRGDAVVLGDAQEGIRAERCGPDRSTPGLRQCEADDQGRGRGTLKELSASGLHGVCVAHGQAPLTSWIDAPLMAARIWL